MALDASADFRPLALRALEELHRAGHVATDLHSSITSAAKSGDVLEALVTYLNELRTWNTRVNLTAARTAQEAVDLTLADALVLATHGANEAANEEPWTWVDVGAGAGAPGLILSLLRPPWSVTLVEPRNKRVAFLRSTIGRLNSRAAVRRLRSDELGEKQWDVAVSRATLNPEAWLGEGTRLARHAVWVLLAHGEPPARSGWRIVRDVSYRWPLTGADRRAVCFSPEPSL